MMGLESRHVVSLLLRAYYERALGACEVSYLGGAEAESRRGEGAGEGYSDSIRSVTVEPSDELRNTIAESAEGVLDVEMMQAAARSCFSLLDGAGAAEICGAQRIVHVAGIGSYLVAPAADMSAWAPPAGTSGGGSSLFGKIAVVTGGARGFGAAISEGLRARGARVCIADIDEAGAQEQAGELNGGATPGQGSAPQRPAAQTPAAQPTPAQPPDAHAFTVDVSNEESVATLVRDVTERFGGIDIFVSNAGVLRAGSVMDLGADEFDLVTKVNYRGFFLCTKHAARLMSRLNHARAALGTAPRYTDIIQINSKSGLSGSGRNGAYSGSKFGGVGLTESFALELVDHYIKVNAVSPGNFFEGPLWSDPETGLFVQYLRAGKVPGAQSVEDVRRFYEGKVPMKRGCRPEDVVRALVYLIEQQYETGQALPVTGGQTMLH